MRKSTEVLVMYNCKQNRNVPAFLVSLPIQGAYRTLITRSLSSQSCHEALSPLVPRRAASLPSSQEYSHQAPTASTTDSSPGQIPVLLLVDHGSRRAPANDMLSEVGLMLQQKTELSVYTAHMELARPTIAEGVNKCVQDGATHIIVVPFFLSPGRHSTTDIPEMTAEAVANHAGVTYDVRPPIGTHPGIIDVILDRAGLLGSTQN